MSSQRKLIPSSDDVDLLKPAEGPSGMTFDPQSEQLRAELYGQLRRRW